MDFLDFNTFYPFVLVAIGSFATGWIISHITRYTSVFKRKMDNQTLGLFIELQNVYFREGLKYWIEDAFYNEKGKLEVIIRTDTEQAGIIPLLNAYLKDRFTTQFSNAKNNIVIRHETKNTIQSPANFKRNIGVSLPTIP